MAIVCRWIVLLLMVISCRAAVVATTPENKAFNAAAEAFRDGFFERAEKELADFATKFPTSPRLPEASLLQAQSRLRLTNYTGAIELLTAGQPAATNLADQYAFWIAEATYKQGNTAKAAELFAAVSRDFPQSSRRLEALVSQATAHANLGDWRAVAAALAATNNPFQDALKSSPSNSLVARGSLLLGQAYLVQGNLDAADQAVLTISNASLDPAVEWRRDHLLCEIRIAQQRFDDALLLVTNLLKRASAPMDPLWAPESTALHARLLARKGRIEEAIAAYERNLVPGLPESYQREALLNITSLNINRGREGLTNAALVLEKFAAQQPEPVLADVLLFTSSELKLREYAALLNDSPAKAAQAKALLDQATAALQKLSTTFTNSPLIGRAQLSLGWCLWLQPNRTAESMQAFRNAAEKLPKSMDHALAAAKLGDTHLRRGLELNPGTGSSPAAQSEYTNAVAAYFAVINGYGESPEARSNLLERVLYQAVRSAILTKDAAAATNALATIQRWYPEGNLMQRSVLLGGIEMSKHDPVEARQMYSDFIKQFPDAELMADVQLALARTYEQQEEWTNAIAQYDDWIARHTNHSGIARAEYSRAWANAQAARTTNAFTLFSGFVNRFPATPLTPLAHWWLGDYYLHQGQLEDAERSYKTIAQSTNWPPSQTTYRAWMMAGRVAFRRSGKQAAQYFTDLWNNTNCPADIRAQALFAYGDTLMATEPAETNKLANYDEAIRVFSRICEMYPTNRIGALAWGQRAACLMQWAQVSGQYDAATNSFRQVIDSPGADGRARAIAKVGLASALESQAQKASSPAEKAELLKAAMNHCLDVLFNSGGVWREGEDADPFWVRKAGLEAARYAEALNQWEQARKVYGRLQELMPVLRARMEKNAARALEQEQLMKAKPPQPALAEKK